MMRIWRLGQNASPEIADEHQDIAIKLGGVENNPEVAASAKRVEIWSNTNDPFLEHFNDFADAEIKKVVKGAPEVVDGYFHISDKPGLGVELDVDAAAEFPQQQARFDLWAEGWEQRKPKGTE
jgi:L-alanine-DL-glutamate epimerase-like enolase superfamily enzyme